jgi:hypothetical protein
VLDTGKDEGNAADGRFSAALVKLDRHRCESISIVLKERGNHLMVRSWIKVLVCSFGFAALFLVTALVFAAEVPRMTTEELKGIIGNPDVVIIDTRADADWKGSDLKINGAVREDPKKMKDWIDKYSKDKTLVFYCA